MISNLKMIGLVWAAVAVMCSVAAGTASAQQGKLTGGNTVIGEQTGTGSANSLTAFGDRIECPGSIYTGHKYNETPHLPLPLEAMTVTVTAHYKDCVNSESNAVTVDMNGCDYVLHVGVTTGGIEHTYGTTADVVCPGNGIQITGGPCTVRIPPQTGLSGAHLKSTTTGDIDLEGTFQSLTAVACGFIHTNNGELDTDVTIGTVLTAAIVD